MAKESKVDRPTKKSEYDLRFATRQASRAWRDLCATTRGPMADAWDFLTRTPLEITPTNYPLKGDLARIVRQGASFERWQLKPTLKGSARIWFYVSGGTVYLEQVHTAHPKQTDN
ncbi:hypothetical protein [Brevibacterium sp. FAM 27836]|uniref:hypothetical protein n=1 Tax=Brevibacterium sp. FAM 27836 TaxID=3446693 RepID=UPI003F51964F